LIDKKGKFVEDTLIIKNENTLHVLNYNSPGATGALPMAAMIVNDLIEDGILLSASTSNSSTINNMKEKRIWDIAAISDQLRGSSGC
jgi:L-2-hydroxyglutarate oxidase